MSGDSSISCRERHHFILNITQEETLRMMSSDHSAYSEEKAAVFQRHFFQSRVTLFQFENDVLDKRCDHQESTPERPEGTHGVL